MFESALIAHKLAKEEYEREEPELRTKLVELQLDMIERRDFATVILVTGMDGAGKSAVIHKLLEWLDPRHVRVAAYGDPDDTERTRPRMWRYWRDLPPRGATSIVFGSWYSEPLRARVVAADDGEAQLERDLAGINRFEEMLNSEGVLLLKFLLVLSAKEQKRRLTAFAKLTGGASRALEEWSGIKHRGRAGPIVEEMVRRTSTGHAPWNVLPCDDPEYRNLAFGRLVLGALQARLAAPPPPAPAAPAVIANVDRRNILDTLDLDLALDRADYRERLREAQLALLEQSQRKAFRRRALVAVFEGHDAAGKGGAIRRVTMALDPRQYRVHPVAAPTDEEKARPYLWRFWRHVPRQGRIAIFDRSWYGRVLVERVEGFASPDEWGRAYGEINDFEEELTQAGIVVVKVWLAIGKDEQLRRFEARAGTEYKQFKITDEDWRNREKWDLYHDAIGEMIDRTSTPTAPWTVVEAQDKRWARVKVVETLVGRLRDEL
jgi:polyphosphate:AMP phosphotransferase